MKFQDLQGERGKFLFIFPNFNPQNGRRFMHFVKELRAVTCPSCTEPVTISGESAIFFEIIRRMFRDGRWVVGASFLGIMLALYVAFRGVRHTIRCAAPFVVGLIWMLGCMGAWNIPFTFVSLAVVPILFGIAIDYPIYLYQQQLMSGEARRTDAYRSIAPPIIGSALTTMIGFGCLLFAQNGGARSFGLAAVIGLVSILVATLVWYPSWLAWLVVRQKARVEGYSVASRTRARENSFIDTMPIRRRPSITGR